MKAKVETKSGHQGGAGAPEIEDSPMGGDHAPRKLTLAENVMLTIKVLVGFGLLGAALWGVSLWKSAN